MAGPIPPTNSHGVHVGLTDVPDVLKWSVNPKSGNSEYASSDTSGWKKRLAGVKDISGSWECLINDTTDIESIVKPGDTIAELHLYQNDTLKWSGPAIIDDISITTDIQTGAPISATVNFSSNGAWTDWS